MRPQTHQERQEWRKTNAKNNGCKLLTLEIQVKDDGSGKGNIYCPEMKCEFPSGNLTKDVAVLVAEYLDLIEMDAEPVITKRKNEAAKLPLDAPKRNRWVGNTLCEVTAMEPRNQGRSSF